MSDPGEEWLVDAVLAGDQDSAVVLRTNYLALAQSLAARLGGDERATERALDAFVARLRGWPRNNELSTYAIWVMRQAIDAERYGPPDSEPRAH